MPDNYRSLCPEYCPGGKHSSSPLFAPAGIIAFAFGDTILPEVQATVGGNAKKEMYKGISMGYSILLSSYMIVAIAGYWAFGYSVSSLLPVTLAEPCCQHAIHVAEPQLHHRGVFWSAGGLLCGVIIYGSDRGDCRRLCVRHSPDCGLLPDLLPAHLRLCLQLHDQVPQSLLCCAFVYVMFSLFAELVPCFLLLVS